MTRDEIIIAVGTAASLRISKMFDVLCSEIAASASEEDETASVARFQKGVELVGRARRLAIAAGETKS